MITSSLISAFAQGCLFKIVNRIILQLQGIKESLSGDYSGLENTWDEICVQIQDEYSIHWNMYEEIVLNLIEVEVNKIPPHEQQAIWLETDSAYSYDEDEDEDELESKYDPSDVYHHIKSIIFQKAGDWSNKRIRSYLERG
ncbi:hypothetical protein JYB62_04845 [Algoriphagus lutimaris]|uniref:hypothetical protein n=1 Tax=Algoriphagus lutimaris TaxID=613197 RepID=UPI00196A6920|nr:hypothetical protein [Algoriphagus lutimaris]MBN3519321.1 hypothetical protein [Algoriphagus lutimaris]